ncbi:MULTISPECIES: urease accessory protein UreD [unclassified Gordonia (in: high G+C Gram-positive bacteria)]|uniref:urease accessory protein UreD n=1 Tax=Gordonia sp. B7-2 TaxID=3420932 RepID=UPI003D8B898C
MQTEVTITARPDRSPRITATGAITVRQTGRHTIHLVGAAATPLGGDDISVRVEVAPGAHLEVRSVAATIALPSVGRADSTARWELTVGEGGLLVVDPEPTIVAAGAQHRSRTIAHLASDAAVAIHERAQIGRRSVDRQVVDAGGSWQGALTVDLDGDPLLRHQTVIGEHPGVPTTHRAFGSVFRFPDTRGDDVDPNEFVARLSLAGGGTLTTALADTAARCRTLYDALDTRAVLT